MSSPDARSSERFTQKPVKRLLGNGFFKRMVFARNDRQSGWRFGR